LTLGPAIMTTPFVIMDIVPTFKALLGRPWVEQTLGVLSTIHQCYKFPHNGKILKVRSLPQVEVIDMITAQGLPPPPQLKLKEPMVSVMDIDPPASPPRPYPSNHILTTCSLRRIGDPLAWKIMGKMGYKPGEGLGRNGQGVRRVIVGPT